MLCPKCEGTELAPMRAQENLEIDYCPKCNGIWFDKSEIYQYVQRPEQFYEVFKEAYQKAGLTRFECPRCSKAMFMAHIDRADLPFEACAQCGGSWFDAGEVQTLNRFLDDWHGIATGSPRIRLGPREPSAEELASYLGPFNAPLYAVIAAAGSTGLCLAVVDPWRTIPGFLCAMGFFSVLWFLIFLSRYWYISGARVINGEIMSYMHEAPTEIEAKIEFTLDELPYQFHRIIRRGSPLDKGRGGTVQVLFNPGYPRGAFLVDADDFRAGRTEVWSEEEREVKMSPQSMFWRGRLRDGGVIPAPLIRLGCLILILIGVEEVLVGKGVYYMSHRSYGLFGAYRTYEAVQLTGIWAKLHGIVMIVTGAFAAIFYNKD